MTKFNGKIYLATSPSGKSYVGQTIRSIESRWKAHIREDGKVESRGCSLLGMAAKKYGWDSFEVIALDYEDIFSQEDLDDEERFWIAHLNTFTPNGYNLTEGGRGIIPALQGDLHPRATTTNEAAAEIRKRFALGETQASLAAEFGIHPGVVTNIIRNKSYVDENYVPPDFTPKKSAAEVREIRDLLAKNVSREEIMKQHNLSAQQLRGIEYEKYYPDEGFDFSLIPHLNQLAENNPGAILNWDRVKLIRTLWPTGKYSQEDLAYLLDQTQTNIGKVVRNDSWFDIDFDPIASKFLQEINSKKEDKCFNMEKNCSVEGCEKDAVALGFCNAHWKRNNTGKDMSAPVQFSNIGKKCEFEGCEEDAKCKGLCGGHYDQLNDGKELKPLRARSEKKEMDGIMFKKCTNPGCDEPWKELNKDNFYWEESKNYWQSRCKDCKIKQQKRYAEKSKKTANI